MTTDTISDDQIDELCASLVIKTGDAYIHDYDVVRKWLVTIIAAERERVKKECIEICEDFRQKEIAVKYFDRFDSIGAISEIKRCIEELK